METVILITYYLCLNQQLFHDIYPLPRIGDTMSQLELFKYLSYMSINKEYYTIEISPHSKATTSIVI